MEELVELFFYAGYMGLALLVPFSNYVLQVEEGWFIEADIMAVNIILAVVMGISMLWTIIITNMYETKDKEKADRMRGVINKPALIAVTILAIVLVLKIFPHHKLWGVVNVTTPVLFKLGIKQLIESFIPIEDDGEDKEKNTNNKKGATDDQ